MKVRAGLLNVFFTFLIGVIMPVACAQSDQPIELIPVSVVTGEPVQSVQDEPDAVISLEPEMTGDAVEEETMAEPTEGGDMQSIDFEISSRAFGSGQPIPMKYTCSGEDVSPQLMWSGTPAGTRSFALVCNDPDAPVGNWIHWVIYNIPADLAELPEAIAKTDMVAGIGVQGVNDSRKTGYNGPCPPAGKPHRYFFTIYALDEETQFQPGLKAGQLYEAIDGHILAEAQWMGTFQR